MTPAWTIECDAPMLEMLEFCVGAMGKMLREDLESGSKACIHGKSRTAACLQAGIKTANRLLAAAIKGPGESGDAEGGSDRQEEEQDHYKKEKGARPCCKTHWK